jgi:type II secretory pathway pseudopilin PulG
MKKIIQQQEGFGLIEVIVGISMLLITSVAALSLSQTVIRTESFNEKRVMAYNLAQQVMEETRRSRDSSWDDLKSKTRWSDGSGVSETIDDAEVLLGEQSGDSYECSVVETENVLNCKVENEEFTVSREILPMGNFANLHDIDSNLRGSDIDEDLARKVVVVVEWDERGVKRDISLTTVLTDWKAY